MLSRGRQPGSTAEHAVAEAVYLSNVLVGWTGRRVSFTFFCGHVPNGFKKREASKAESSSVLELCVATEVAGLEPGPGEGCGVPETAW